MALGTGEAMDRGFIREVSTGAVVVTSDSTGATVQHGYLRDADGRLVVSAQ